MHLMKKIFKTKQIKNIIIFFKNILSIKKNLLLKKLRFNHVDNIIFLGSDYGGWSFLKDRNLKDKFIISAGLGEDASFDIELINKHNCKVISVDPTPRAISHYNQIMRFSGSPNKLPYKDHGKQDVSSYNLKNINNENFILIKKALYNCDDKELKFFEPPNKNHVSYSLNDWQNNYKQTSDFIFVKTIMVKTILKKFNIETLEMIKLDIEGSEIEVINKMFEDNIFPNQILVEFDELNKISEIAIERFLKVYKKLLSADYILVKTNSKFPDFLFLKKNYLEKNKLSI